MIECTTFKRMMKRIIERMRMKKREELEGYYNQKVADFIEGVSGAVQQQVGKIGEIITESCIRVWRKKQKVEVCIDKSPGSQSMADIWEYLPSKGEINLYQVKSSITGKAKKPDSRDIKEFKKLVDEIWNEIWKYTKKTYLEVKKIEVKKINVWWVEVDLEILDENIDTEKLERFLDEHKASLKCEVSKTARKININGQVIYGNKTVANIKIVATLLFTELDSAR